LNEEVRGKRHDGYPKYDERILANDVNHVMRVVSKRIAGKDESAAKDRRTQERPQVKHAERHLRDARGNPDDSTNDGDEAANEN
jgi:hypothetical protein